MEHREHQNTHTYRVATNNRRRFWHSRRPTAETFGSPSIVSILLLDAARSLFEGVGNAHFPSVTLQAEKGFRQLKHV